MREPRLASQILEIVSKRGLNKNALTVFIMWFAQSSDFHPSNSVIEDRTGISKANISRAWEELLRKGIVWLTGYTRLEKGKRSINNYSLSGNILAEARALTKKRGIGKVIQLYEE